MVWFKVDDLFATHPKALRAGNAACGLWVRAGSWSAAQLTDGVVGAEVIAVLGGKPADARRLVDARLWHDHGHDCGDCPPVDPGSYLFHGWDEFQPTRADVESDRSAAKERMRKVRSNRRRSGDVRANTDRTNAEVRLTPTRPDPSPAAAAAERSGGDGLTAELRIFRDKIRAVPAFRDLSFEIAADKLDDIHHLVALHGDKRLIDNALQSSFHPVPSFVSAFLPKWRALAAPGTALHVVEERCPECNYSLSACDAMAITDPEFCPRKESA